MNANTIDDVLSLLPPIIADNKKRRDPLGYFPALYRQITLQVKEGIQSGAFDDGPRMSRFDSKTKLLGRLVADPPEPVGTVVRRIRSAESTDVVAIITALDNLV